MEKGKNVGTIASFRDNADLRKKWPAFLCFGLLLVILGILAIIYAGWTTLLTVSLVGFFLIAGGILLLISAFTARKWTGVLLSILLGILYLVAGGIFLYNPGAAASGLTLLLATVFFVGGLFRMIFALAYRFDYAPLWFLSGLIAFVLGLCILSEWPIASFWIIGVFIGIDLIVSGLGWIAVSLGAKSRLS